MTDSQYLYILKVLGASALGGAGVRALSGLFSEDRNEVGKYLAKSVKNEPAHEATVITPDKDGPKPKPASKGQYKFSSEQEYDSEGYPIQSNLSPWANSWTIPLATAAMAGGTYGGYTLLDKILGGVEKRDTNDDIEREREEYVNLLKERRNLLKASSLDEELNTQFENFEKKAFGAGNLTAVLGGLGLTAAGTIGILSHLSAKANADASSPGRNKYKTLLARLKAEESRGAAPIRLTPVLAPTKEPEKKDDKLDVMPTEKAAAEGLEGIADATSWSNNLETQKWVQNKAGEVGDEAWADPKTGDAITGQLMAPGNKEQAQKAIADLSSEKINNVFA